MDTLGFRQYTCQYLAIYFYVLQVCDLPHVIWHKLYCFVSVLCNYKTFDLYFQVYNRKATYFWNSMVIKYYYVELWSTFVRILATYKVKHTKKSWLAASSKQSLCIEYQLSSFHFYGLILFMEVSAQGFIVIRFHTVLYLLIR